MLLLGSCQWVQTLMLDICKIEDAIEEKKLQCSYQNQRKLQGGCITSVQIGCASTLDREQIRLGMHQISKGKVKLVI